MSNRTPIGYDPDKPLTGALSPAADSATNSEVARKMGVFETIFLPYPRHIEFHSRCDYLVKLGQETRGRPQRGMRVLAPSGSGKSTAAEEFIRLLEEATPPTEHFVPAIKVSLEEHATSRKLMVAILTAFADENAEKGNEMQLRSRAYACFERLHTKILFVDEVQHLQNRGLGQRDVTDSLKGFLDGGVVPVVFLGTEEGEGLFTRNMQLSGRLLPPNDFKPLRRDHVEDRRLLAGYVSALDEAIVECGLMKLHAGLDDPWIRGCLHEISAGVIGRISRLVEHALENAIRRGAECLEVHDLSIAVDSWAVMGGFIDHNPFRQGQRL